MYGSEASSDIAVVPLQTCNVFIVGPVRWKAQIEQADWKEIAEFPWIWPSDNCPFCQTINEEFQQRNLRVSKVAIADQEPTLKMLVTSGVGLTLMIEDEALATEQEGRVVIWTKHKFQVDLSFAYLRKREHDPVIQAILNGLFILWDITDRGAL